MFNLKEDTKGKVERKAIVFAIDVSPYFPVEIRNELFQETKKAYSCPLLEKRLLKGLSESEERNCPLFISEIGVSENSGEFTQAVKEYWTDFTYKIPFSDYIENKADNAIEINGSYKIVNGKLEPDDLNDFLLYNIMLQDKWVGKTMKATSELSQYKFIMIDKLEKEQDDIVRVENDTKIITKLAALFNLPNFQEVARQILLTSKEHSYESIIRMSEPERTTALTTFANKKSEKFLKMASSKDLSDAALIMELIALNVLRVEDEVIYNEADRIGSINNAIAYLNDPKMASKVSILKEKSMEAKENVVVNDTFS